MRFVDEHVHSVVTIVWVAAYFVAVGNAYETQHFSNFRAILPPFNFVFAAPSLSCTPIARLMLKMKSKEPQTTRNYPLLSINGLAKINVSSSSDFAL